MPYFHNHDSTHSHMIWNLHNSLKMINVLFIFLFCLNLDPFGPFGPLQDREGQLDPSRGQIRWANHREQSSQKDRDYINVFTKDSLLRKLSENLSRFKKYVIIITITIPAFYVFLFSICMLTAPYCRCLLALLSSAPSVNVITWLWP